MNHISIPWPKMDEYLFADQGFDGWVVGNGDGFIGKESRHERKCDRLPGDATLICQKSVRC